MILNLIALNFCFVNFKQLKIECVSFLEHMSFKTILFVFTLWSMIRHYFLQKCDK